MNLAQIVSEFCNAVPRRNVEELLARVPEYELCGDPGWKTSIWARAHRQVPVRFTSS